MKANDNNEVQGNQSGNISDIAKSLSSEDLVYTSQSR